MRKNTAILLFDDVEVLDFAGPFEVFVDNGTILTAAGISAGIDCSLHVVERMLGPEAATATARHMEYRRA